MAENMMNSAHKATNERYRNEYDRIFKKQSATQKRRKRKAGLHPIQNRSKDQGEG